MSSIWKVGSLLVLDQMNPSSSEVLRLVQLSYEIADPDSRNG